MIGPAVATAAAGEAGDALTDTGKDRSRDPGSRPAPGRPKAPLRGRFRAPSRAPRDDAASRAAASPRRIPWKLLLALSPAIVLAAPILRLESVLAQATSGNAIARTSALEDLATPGLPWAVPGYEGLLAGWKRSRVFPVFLQAAGRSTQWVSDAVNAALPSEADRLLAALAGGGDSPARLGAARVVFRLSGADWVKEDARFIDALSDIVADPDYQLRVSALLALSRIGGPAQADIFHAAARDEDFRIRGLAAEALARHLGADALPRLRVLLGDDSQYTRSETAIWIAREAVPGGVDLLLEALADRAHPGRPEAADGLGLAGSRRALEPLATVYRERKAGDRLRLSVVKALGRIGGAGAVDPLAAALRDRTKPVRLEALRGLARCGRPEAVGRAAAYLRHTVDWDEIEAIGKVFFALAQSTFGLASATDEEERLAAADKALQWLEARK